jgi:hypothetical protein
LPPSFILTASFKVDNYCTSTVLLDANNSPVVSEVAGYNLSSLSLYSEFSSKLLFIYSIKSSA